MNSLDDLRSTLGHHADDVHDAAGPGTAARAAAVHQRVRVVRRRRRAVAAGGVAAVLAVVGGVALLPDGARQATPEPATTIVGLTPPASLVATGFTYGLDRGVESNSARTSLDLAASDEPRLVSWATAGDDDRVTVTGPGLPGPVAFDDADFTNWVLVPAGSDSRVRAVAATGEDGLAVYTLGVERPAGLTSRGVTFRADVAGLDLLGAAVGEPGEAEVSYEATATSRGIALKYFCSSSDPNAYLHIDTGEEGGLLSGGGCGDLVPVDPASSGGSTFPTEPGEDVSTRFYVTDGRDGPLVEDPSMRIGIGTYAVDEEVPQVAGRNGFFPYLREEAGHTWQRISLSSSAGLGDGRSDEFAPGGRGAVLAVVGLRLRNWRTARGLWDGSRGDVVLGGVTSQSTWAVVADLGTVTLVLSGCDDPIDAQAQNRMDVAFYERVD